MVRRQTRRKWTAPFRINVAFRVPLDFAFGWCTDFTPDDAKLEGDSYQRKIVERSARRVVLEDLEDTKGGWLWSREVVTLLPPNRWHMDGFGSRAEVTADYTLSRVAGERTRLDLRWRRRPWDPSAPQLTKAQREASARRGWKRFGAAMERDFRRARRTKTK